MFKKSVSVLLGVTLVAATLAGCGDSGSTTGETTAKSDASAETKAETSAGTAAETDASSETAATSEETKGEASGENVTLTVFDAEAYGLERYDQMVKGFEKAHPGVKVDVQHASNDSQTLLKSRLNSDDVPDVFAVQPGVDANSFYPDYAYDWSDDKEMVDLFNEGAVNTGLDEEGKVMSLPSSYQNMGLIYNKDSFEKAGIKELPTTITQLEDACKKLEAVGITPFSLAAKEGWVLAQIATHFMMDKSLDAAGVVQGINDGEITFDSMKNFKNIYAFLDLAVKYGPDKPLEIDWETSENMLASGEAAMIHMGDWCQATLDDFNKDANLAFLPFPVSESPEDTTLLSSIAWTHIVNKDSENLELAKEYVKYIMTSEDGLDWLCNTMGAVPSAKGEFEIAGDLANDAASYISGGKTNGWIHTLYPQGFVDNVMGPTLQSYMLGESTAEDATAAIQEGWAY